MKKIGNKKINKLCILGAGNLGYHFINLLASTNFPSIQIYDRSIARLEEIKKLLNLPAHFTTTTLPDQINTGADAYILCLSEHAILPIMEGISHLHGQLFLHTSGSIGMDIFQRFSENYGVLYPLQTFTFGVPIHEKSFPCFIEGSNDHSADVANEIARLLTDKVYPLNSRERLNLHLSAVMANNLTNHILTLTSDYMTHNQLPFSYITPLIKETAYKASVYGPGTVQTGPAVRNNKTIIDNHSNLLANEQNLKDIYKIISESIIAYYQK